MVNGGHDNAEDVAETRDEDEETALTQNDGRNHFDDEGSYPTQVVAPQEPQAFLRYKEEDPRTQRSQQEIRLQLPIDHKSEILINLGRLRTNDKNAANYQQIVCICDPNRPFDKQIISREHSQIQIRKSASGVFSIGIKDSKNHDRRSPVVVTSDGVSRRVKYDMFTPLSHGNLIHLTPLAPAIVGDPSVLLKYSYFQLILDFPESKIENDKEGDVDDSADICSIKFLLPSAMVGTLMGRGGETIRAIRADNDCDIEVSPWG